jgi:hypothetical protein
VAGEESPGVPGFDGVLRYPIFQVEPARNMGGCMLHAAAGSTGVVAAPSVGRGNVADSALGEGAGRARHGSTDGTVLASESAEQQGGFGLG